MVFFPPPPPGGGNPPRPPPIQRTNFQRAELLTNVRCPECGCPMLERQSAKGPFYGCSRYPLCVGTRPNGEGIDSYTRLLREAYTKALVYLASPKQLGAGQAANWLLSEALGCEVTDPSQHPLLRLANDVLEKSIDVANAYAAEHGNDLDFLVLAHEERMVRVRSSLRRDVPPALLRRMPKPEIVRRYDDSDIAVFEAHIAPEQRNAGRYCPRCGGWSEEVRSVPVREKVTSATKPPTSDEIFEMLFRQEVVCTWDCGHCGKYSQVDSGHSHRPFVFEKDKDDPNNVAGASFGIAAKNREW